MTVQDLINSLNKVPNKTIPVVIEDTDYKSGWTCHEIKSIWETKQTFIHKNDLVDYKCVMLKCGMHE